MTHLPDPGFAIWSPCSLKIRANDRKSVLAELRREEARRTEYYPTRIHDGRMTEMDASIEISLIAAIASEYEWAIGDFATRGAVPANRFTWAEKLNGLRRELIIRRDTFPKMVREGRMTDQWAEEHLSLLEAAHAWYWNDGLYLAQEFTVAGDAGATMARIREELERRDAWARNGGPQIGPDDVEIIVDGHAVRHHGPGPFRHYGGSLWSVVNDAGEDGLFGVDERLEPKLQALDPDERVRTLFEIAYALTRAWERRVEPTLFEDQQQQAA